MSWQRGDGLTKRRGLGRGLQALIPVTEKVPQDKRGAAEIDIEAIQPATSGQTNV